MGIKGGHQFAFQHLPLHLFYNLIAIFDIESLVSPVEDLFQQEEQFKNCANHETHAPLTTKTCSSHPTDPWITSEALDAKQRQT